MEGNISKALSVIMGSKVNNVIDGVSTNETPVLTGTLPSNDFDLQMTRFVVQRILVPFVTCVGVLGNVISICVLVQRSMTSSTNCYLTALSVFDMLYLVFSFTLSWDHYQSVKTLPAYKYWFPYARVFADVCANVSVYLTLTFSFERLIAVCHPMKGRIICTPRRARMISLVVICVVSACTSLEFFELKTIETINGNDTLIDNVYTEFAESNFYSIGYYYFLIIAFTILPLVLLSTFNSLLIRSVLKAVKIRRQMTCVSSQPPSDTSRRHREQQRITGMLIGVVVIFLVCQTPNAVILIYSTYLRLGEKKLNSWQRNAMRIAGNVVNLMILLNASLNFIIYSFMSTKFRRVFLKIFCKYSPFIKHDITRTYSSYYGNTTMTSKSPRSSVRFCDIGDRKRNGHMTNNRISTRCVHPVLEPSGLENSDFKQKRNSFRSKKTGNPISFSTRRSCPNEKKMAKGLYSRPHIKYHISATVEHPSDSEENDFPGRDQSLEEMAKARERGSQKCQCFHITSLRCLDDEDSGSGQSKIADTSM